MTVPHMAQTHRHKVEIERGKAFFRCTWASGTNQPFYDNTYHQF